jgi:predicted dehydrogenase
LEDAGVCRLICTCDPSDDALQAARARWNLDGRGVRVWTDYREMLDVHVGELDVVTIPTPPPLHAEMHRACVERNLACYLEKPPTLDPDELERMITVDAGARKQTQVAFNFIIEEPRQALKRRLLAGEFGALRRASFVGLWPRASDYYARAAWAGRLLGNDGRLVLDSCIGNALAHHVTTCCSGPEQATCSTGQTRRAYGPNCTAPMPSRAGYRLCAGRVRQRRGTAPGRHARLRRAAGKPRSARL